MRGFLTDAFSWNNLGAGTSEGSPAPISYIEQSRLASFFGRVNYGYKKRDDWIVPALRGIGLTGC